MKTLLEIFVILLIGTALGYAWAYHSYKPLELQAQIERLKASNKMLCDGYTKQFSKHFVEEK